MHILTTIFYTPLYNALVYILDIMPGKDLGLAVIVFTCVVKFVLLPLSRSSVKTQIKMKALEPELNKIKEKTANNRDEQARQIMAFYKANDLNPFSGFFLILIQFPIIFALAAIFYRSGLPHIDQTQLYSFVSVPSEVKTMFLGFLDVTKTNIALSILVGITQFVQIRLSVPAFKPTGNGGKQEDFAKSMNTNIRFVMPAFVFFISLGLTSAISLYWITSNVFAILQELYFRKTIRKNN